MRNLMVLSASIALGGCLVDRGEADASEIPKPVLDAFENNCARPACHDATSAAANLSLAPDDLADAIGKSTPSSEFPLIEIGDLYGSYIALKMLGDPTIEGEPMPLGGTAAQYETSLILAWIAGLEIAEKIDPPPAPPDPTFTEDVWPVLEENCSCHQTAGPTMDLLDLSEDAAYDNIVDVDTQDGSTRLVDPGNPRTSQIWLSVTDTVGVRMPASGGPLTGRELQIIRDWILADAPE